MKTALILLPACALIALTPGCGCTTDTIFSANGNVTTGVVGGSVEIKSCTPLERQVATELKTLSDWYRTHWDSCGSSADPTQCRSDLHTAYKAQQDALLKVLQQMKGKSTAEQKKLYQELLLRTSFSFQ